MHRLTYYEDCIQLDLPIDKDSLDLNSLNWVQYNPRKNINRFGCSITSADGSDTGIPDLDSLYEYNKLNGTELIEKNFITPTKHSKPFTEFLSMFEVGRSHYLKLGPGGFFPWHRDNDPITFRIIYTIKNCTSDNLIWIEDEKVLPLQNDCWYYINTRKKHALFAFDDAIFAVFNVIFTGKTFNLIQKHMYVK